MHVCTAYQRAPAEARGQLSGVSFLFLPGGSQGSNSHCPGCYQARVKALCNSSTSLARGLRSGLLPALKADRSDVFVCFYLIGFLY